MSDLLRLLKSTPPGETTHDAPGEESGWLDFVEWSLSSGKLLICDLGYMPSEGDGLVVDLSPGKYVVQGKVMTYPGDRRVSRFRLVKPGVEAALGEELGDTWTDTASTAICDLVTMTKIWDRVGEDDAMDRLDTAREDIGSMGVFDLEPGAGAIAPFVSSGFGDGTFPVFELKAGGRRVGIEVQFIAPDERYPFGATARTTREEDRRGADDDPQFKAFAEMLSEVLAERTGDRDRDREAMRGKFDEFLEGMKAKATAAADEFRQHVVKQRRGAPAIRIKVRPSADEAWLQREPVAGWRGWLERQGFEKSGVFVAEPIPNFIIFGLVHPGLRIRAQITQTPKQTALILASRLADGTEYSVVNLPAARGMIRPGWAVGYHVPGGEPEQLLEEFQMRRPPGELQAIQPRDFVAWEEAIFLRTQTWRAERGGWSVDEIKNQRGLDPDAETTDELIMARHDSAEMWLYNWLRLQPNLPFQPASVIEELVIIHDDLTLELLLNEWWSATKDFSARERLFEEGTPREAFARVNRERGEPLRRVLTKPQPYEADFYLPRRG